MLFSYTMCFVIELLSFQNMMEQKKGNKFGKIYLKRTKAYRLPMKIESKVRNIHRHIHAHERASFMTWE
jgi:hypothetical protein